MLHALQPHRFVCHRPRTCQRLIEQRTSLAAHSHRRYLSIVSSLPWSVQDHRPCWRLLWLLGPCVLATLREVVGVSFQSHMEVAGLPQGTAGTIEWSAFEMPYTGHGRQIAQPGSFLKSKTSDWKLNGWTWLKVSAVTSWGILLESHNSSHNSGWKSIDEMVHFTERTASETNWVPNAPNSGGWRPSPATNSSVL